MTQRSLFLHIGTGKAGSTTIQHMLGDVPQTGFGYRQVEAFGLGNAWKLAAASGTDLARSYWVEDRKELSVSEFDALGRVVWQAAAEELANAPKGPFVVSSEYIFAQYGALEGDIARLKARLDPFFDDIVIIVYLREQVSYLKSVYAQRIKGPMRKTESYESFIKRIDDIKHLWDYRGALDAWGNVFGRDALTVSVFDTGNFQNGDLIADFRHRIGVKDTELTCGTGAGEALQANRSPSYTQLQLLRRLNGLPRPLAVGPLRTLAMNRRMRGGEFPDRFDKDVLARVSADNTVVNTTYLADQTVRLPVLAPAL